MATTNVRVILDESNYGDAIAELNRRGAMIISLQNQDASAFEIDAAVPSSEIEGFKGWLSKLTFGKGHVMELAK